MGFQKIKNYLKEKLFPESEKENAGVDLKLLNECETMFNYAASDGMKIKDWISSDLAEISIKKAGFTKAGLKFRGEEESAESPENLREDSKKLALIHAALSEIVAPATPLTIQYTIPRSRFFFGEKTTIPLIRNIWIMSILFLVGFIITFNLYDQNRIYMYQAWHLFFSAGLGAYFYSLYTANKYFITRTFDPKYSTFYNNRIIIGIIAGFILANLIDAGNFNSSYHNIPSTLTDAAIPVQKKSADINMITRLSPSIIALLGGYSADAVNKILSRLVAMLTALVQGETKDIIASKEAEWKSKSELASIKNRLDYSSKVMNFIQENKTNLDPALLQKLNDMISTWLKVQPESK